MTDVLRVIESAAVDEDYARHLALLEAHLVRLPDKPEETPETTLRALWLRAAREPCSAEAAVTRDLPPIDVDAREELALLVERRLAGVPLAHLTGRQSFMGLELLAGPEALVPRRETELLGYAALHLLRRTVAERGRALVFDVCTGSGNLALALASREPACEVVAGDLSSDAIALARRNADRTRLARRVRFLRGDLFAPFEAAGLRGAADLIVCNPPYISTAKVPRLATEIAAFEPRLAFDGGALGISILFRLVADAPKFLKPGSWLCFEVGAGQDDRMAARLRRTASFSVVERVRDGAGQVRVMLARTRGST